MNFFLNTMSNLSLSVFFRKSIFFLEIMLVKSNQYVEFPFFLFYFLYSADFFLACGLCGNLRYPAVISPTELGPIMD